MWMLNGVGEKLLCIGKDDPLKIQLCNLEIVILFSLSVPIYRYILFIYFLNQRLYFSFYLYRNNSGLQMSSSA